MKYFNLLTAWYISIIQDGEKAGLHLQACETQFILVLFINYCIIFHTNNFCPTLYIFPTFLGFIFRFYLYIFRQRGREAEREGAKHQCVRKISIGSLSHAVQLGTGPQPRHVP